MSYSFDRWSSWGVSTLLSVTKHLNPHLSWFVLTINWSCPLQIALVICYTQYICNLKNSRSSFHVFIILFVKFKVIIIKYKLSVFPFRCIKKSWQLFRFMFKILWFKINIRSISYLISWGRHLLREREDKNMIFEIKSWCGTIKKGHQIRTEVT